MVLVWLWCVMALVGTSTMTPMPCPLPWPAVDGAGAGHWSVRVATTHNQSRSAELKVRILPTPERVETSVGQLTLQKMNGDYYAIIPGNLTLAPDIDILITYKDPKSEPLLKYLEIDNLKLCNSESIDTHKHVGDKSAIDGVKDFLSQEKSQDISKISSMVTSKKNHTGSSIKNIKSGTPDLTPKIKAPEKMNESNMNAERTSSESNRSISGKSKFIKYTLDQNITNDIVANVSDIVMDKVVKMLHHNMKSCCKGMKNAMSLSNNTYRNIANNTLQVKMKPTNGNVQTSIFIVTKLPSSTSSPSKHTGTTFRPQNKITLPADVALKYNIKNGTVATAKAINTTSNSTKILLQLPQSNKFTNKRLLVNHMQPINISKEAPKHGEHSNTTTSDIQLENKKDENTTEESVGNISAELTTYLKDNENKQLKENKKSLQNMTETNDGYLVLNLKLVKPLIDVEKDNELQVYKKIKEMESDLERLDKEIMLRYVESDPDQEAIRKMENDMEKFFSVNNLRKALREDAAQPETPTTEDYFTSLETTIPTTYFNMLR